MQLHAQSYVCNIAPFHMKNFEIDYFISFQMQRVTKDKCLEVINKFEPSKEGKRKGQLGIDGMYSQFLY